MHSVYSQYRCERFRRGKSVVGKAFPFLTACLLKQITQTSWHLLQITLLKFQIHAFSLIQLAYMLLASAKNVNLPGERDSKQFKKQPLPSSLLPAPFLKLRCARADERDLVSSKTVINPCCPTRIQKIYLKYIHVTCNYVSLNITMHHYPSAPITVHHYTSLNITTVEPR